MEKVRFVSRIMMRKIGLFGGSFNPVHHAHLILAQEAASQLNLDKVVFMPAYLPPHKRSEGLVDSEHRYNMLKIAVQNNPLFSVSDSEIRREGVSFTIDTVKELLGQYGGETELYLIVGMDMLEDIPNWRKSEELISLCKFAGAGRPGYDDSHLHPGVLQKLVKINMPQMDISSTEIRHRLSVNLPVRYWLPDPVVEYIKQSRLYETK